ncbi:MAG: hypothetical protein WBI17_11115 [Clostridiaceae bacterium]
MATKVLEKDKYIFLERPAIEIYNKNEILRRAEEIKSFLAELDVFKIKLLDLTNELPKKEDRNLLLNAAIIMNHDEQLLDKFMTQREIPFKHLSKVIEEPVFELQNLKGYLAAYTLLLQEGKYPLLKRYLQYSLKENRDSFPKEDLIFSGVSIKALRNRTILLTSQGEFILIKGENDRIAEVSTGTRTIIKRHWKKPLAFVIVALIVFSGIAYKLNTTIENTIIIKAVGEVKLEYNPFGKMVTVKGINADGLAFVLNAEFADKSIDTTIGEIIEQAYILEVIKERDDVTILISGTPLPDDYFKQGQTHERILSYQLNAKINNDGNFLHVE